LFENSGAIGSGVLVGVVARSFPLSLSFFYNYWVVRKVRAAKDLNLINEIKNLNLLRFNFPSKSARTFRTTQ